MKLEDLQQKSDKELNRLAAVHILWGGIRNIPSDDWKPTEDMNQAYRLMQMLIPKWTVSIAYNLSGWEVGMWTGVKDRDKYILAANDSFPRAITIAAI